MASKIPQQLVAQIQQGAILSNSLLDNSPSCPSIGLLLCRTQNKVIAEYALRDVNKPLRVSSYQLAEALPLELKGQLPSVEELEREFEGLGGSGHDE